jgi:hypothetical protein
VKRNDEGISMASIDASPEQLKALEVFKALIKDAEGRRAFTTAETTAEKERAFNRKRGRSRLRDAEYNEIPEPARQLLEALSDSELALLADLDHTFVEAGLSVQGSGTAFMIH